MNNEKYLPLGTVVLLKGGKKNVMICGFAVRGKETGDAVYDYIACLYPEGIISTDKNMAFNHDQIEKIIAYGYSDDEQKTFNAKLKELVEKQGVPTATTPANDTSGYTQQSF